MTRGATPHPTSFLACRVFAARLRRPELACRQARLPSGLLLFLLRLLRNGFSGRLDCLWIAEKLT